jgi:hypothetical protein
MAHKEPAPVRITTAPTSHSDDLGARQRRYIISMSIRTICFVLAIVFREHWYCWVFVAASFFLPYVAVVAANAGAAPDPGGPTPFDPDRRALETSSSPRR